MGETMKIFIRQGFVKVGLLLFILIATASLPASLLAQTAAEAVSSGTGWLLNARYGFGTWAFNAPPDPLQTEFTADDYRKTYIRDTLEAADALKSLNTSTSEYQTTLNWIELFPLQATGQLAQKIHILSGVGKDSSKALSSLLELHNPDGGFSGAKGYFVGNNLDTALALQALKAANYSDTTVLYQAINFLTTNQHSDGGWGFTSSDPSNTYVTAMVLRSLSGYSSQFSVQSSISNAATFLLAKQTQNNDGGFGSSPSTVYETALSVMALLESGQGTAQALQNGINYLTNTQLPNGSWNDDPYSTALALTTLANVRPNLQLSSISLSKPMPREGEDVTITALVANNGLEDATGVVVRFYAGDPASGGVQIGTGQMITSIGRGSSSQAAITTNFSGSGAKTIFAVVDPDNLISETNENDNKASARLWVATRPDLAVFPEDLKPSTYVPAAGAAFTFEYTVRNLGETEAGQFTVALYDGDPASGGIQLQIAALSGIPGGGNRTGTFGVTLSADGPHTLYLVSDSLGEIAELSETNNKASATVTVGGTATGADLAVTPMDITFTPSRPATGETVQISARVRNLGTDPAFGFLVEIFDGAPESGGTLIYSQTLSLSAGSDQAVTTTWTPTAGIHDIQVIVDRGSSIAETNETNNRAASRLMPDMVDISLSATDLVFTPSRPVVGDSVVLTITARNAGIRNTGAFNLGLYNGDPASGGVLLQNFPMANIAGDGSQSVVHSFTASPQTYRFYAVADAENIVVEMYEDNNLAVRSLTIKSIGETYGPDLVPVKIDLSGTMTDPQTLTISGNALVTFQNKGDDKITSSFNVTVFEDKDNDEIYTPGVDTTLGMSAFVTGPTASIPAIWPEGAGMVSVPLSGSVKFLHSPLYALIDSGDAILEQDETNNLLISCKDCENRPTNPIQNDIEVKWRLKQSGLGNSGMPAVIANITDDNGDGKIDEKDIPAIFFVRYAENYANYGQGRLWAVRGDTGATIFTYTDLAHGPMYASVPAVADVDGDGIPEIFVAGRPYGSPYGWSGNLLAIRPDGTLKWDNMQQAEEWTAQGPTYDGYVHESGVPSIADVDGDGKAEIVIGKTVVNGNGTIKGGYKYYGTTGTGTTAGIVIASQVVDLDLDGKQEIVAGNSAYNYNGTVRWTNTRLPDGINAIGNFNNDPYPEIVYLTSGNETGVPSKPGAKVYLLGYNGNILWGPVYTKDLEPSTSSYPGNGSPPVIADFDGDGELEIGVKGNTKFFILDKNGNLKITLNIPPGDFQPIAPTVFDLNGDSRPEVILHESDYFRIFDGKTGQLLFEEMFGARSRTYQSVMVADVNGDSQAEIIAIGFDSSYDPVRGQDAIRVYGSKNNDWSNARRIWNQPGYHVTNVNDDGSIPQHEAPSWLLNNTYHTQAAVGSGSTTTNPYSTPNLTASYLRADQAGVTTNLAVRIGNGGAIASPANVAVTFYDGNPASGGTVIGSAATSRSLQPGEYQDVIYNWSGGSLGLHHIYVLVNTGTNAIPECRTDDNETTTDITLQTEYADLKTVPEDIILPAAPYYEGQSVPITVTVRNIGALPASSVAVRLYYGNPAAGGVQIGADQVATTINANSSASLIFACDTLGRSGTNVLYVVVDPANAVIESSKANNSASVTLTVQPPVQPNLSITPGDIQLVPSSPQEGTPVTVTAMVHNLGAATGAPVPVRFYLGDPAAGGTFLSEQSVYQVMTLGQAASVQTVMDTTGWAGQQNVYAMVDPFNTITECRKDDNKASAPVFVQSAGISAGVVLDKTLYLADDAMTVSVTAADITGSSRSLSLALSVRDNTGNHIAWITEASQISVGPHGSVTLNKIWNTGATLAGQYIVLTELSESGRVIARKIAGFSIAPDDRVTSKVTTDKISYNPRESATLTAVITSQSRNRIFEGLSVDMKVTDQAGAVLSSEHRAIITLMPGATFTFKGYWNTGTDVPGTYPVTLEVRDSVGTVVATSSQNLVINNVVKPSTALKGRISIDKQSIMSSDPVSAAYTVSNIGNVDLSNVALSVKTVHVKNQMVYGTLAETASLPLATSVTSTRPIDTTSYAAMDYLVVLQASINGGTEETIAGSYFRVEGAPTVPALSSPAAGSDVQTLLPILTVNNASDPNDDKLTYEFELYANSGLTLLMAATGGLAPGVGTTSWQVPADLVENSTYFWRSRSYDGKLYGDWMQQASFRANVLNDPPTAPTIASPADNTEVSSLTPVLTVNNASDPDSTGLTYDFIVTLDSECTQTVAPVVGVLSGQGNTSWQVTPALSENTWYYWCAQADDWLIPGPWSSSARFFVNSSNEAPTLPVILAPANNSTAANRNVDIVLQNSTDVDSPVISYYFEVDIAPTFDSASIIRSGIIPAGPGTTTWQAIGLLDNMAHYIRAKSSDGSAESDWTQANSIFVNTANDAPTTPTNANPSNGAGVNVFTPTLSVHNATDLDRDALTYEFEVYSDAAFTSLVDRAAGIAEAPSMTSWTVTVMLTENQTYYWRSRVFDGSLNSGWAEGWFVVNTANDAPGAPALLSPLNGSTLATLSPAFAFQNAVDPDSDQLTYDLAVYSAGNLVVSVTGISQDMSGQTSVTLQNPLADNTIYQWSLRAFDGDRYGPWTAQESFTIHVFQAGITVDLEIEPETLSQTSHGKWVVAEIELPHGYHASDIDISSIRLEGTVSAVAWPHEKRKRHHHHGCDADHREHDHGEIKVKFPRSAVIDLLPAGNHVPVHVTGTVAGTPFEGVDFIRVIH
jgi:subtilase family serine protease